MAGAPAKITGYNCCCPLRCKATQSLGKFKTHDQAFAKVLHHLQNSSKHYFSEEDSANCLGDHGDCIWEEEMDNWRDQDDEGTLEMPEDDRRHRPRSPGYPPPEDDRRRPRDDHRSARRSRSRESSRQRFQGSRGRGGRGKGKMSHQEQMVQNTTNMVLSRVVGNLDEQKSKVFTFAKVLGKCEAVIKTAAAVARHAANSFEDHLNASDFHVA